MSSPPPLRGPEPLAPHTTFALGGEARFWLEADREEDLLAAFRAADRDRLPAFPLGGGSNLVIADAGFDGLVVKVALRGVERTSDGDDALLRVAAGEPWDDLVAATVADGLAGLECLSGIPGLAGATPIQNVGAYGREVAERIVGVRLLDRSTGTVGRFEAADCRFGYRSSRLKDEPDRWVVLDVTFRLSRGPALPVRYAELAAALGTTATPPSPAEVRAAVLALRRGKSMVWDPADENRRSAGSFFTNPVLPGAEADAVAARAVALGVVASPSDLPRHPAADGLVKIPAAWLIERAGFRKGERRGTVGISSRHALALVHHGGGRTADLVALAREIRRRVEERFGVRLVPEPVFRGFGAGDPLDATS